MANNYFRFKEFIIYQDACAMKVCTDACILGAWAACKTEQLPGNANLLDIGCGTGLLSLMLAQKSNGDIDAIEINADASKQAKENVEISPWKDRIHIQHVALQNFDAGKKYAFIVCNPPFYESDLASPDESKNAARHDTALRFDELIPFIKNKLDDDGKAAVLIPYQRTQYFSAILKEYDLFINEFLFIKQSPKHPFFRSILLFSHKNVLPVECNELTIQDQERNYTTAFRQLLENYYLNL